ncbi:hypothetical protein I3842_16G038000 [Carya illinoinensis]|uniref:ATP-dependent DNA helicase n=1 Tax=Carya illinoinensis TaxID=32201 RepID=A0A921ZZT3_CARIL|nr:hypothetical protein I3842_16G038000 [Carya illinoinensis]
MGGQSYKRFKTQIRSYYAVLAMTSMGGNVDNNINDGTLHLIDGSNPRFAQLYFYNTENESSILTTLVWMLNETNALVKVFHMIKDCFLEDDAHWDIFVEYKGGLKMINELHPPYMALQYPLLFPYGEDGFRLGILFSQESEDAMAICWWAGYPDVFLTFTCNAKWIEIESFLSKNPRKKVEDQPDIVTRVFKIKLDQLLHDLKHGQNFRRYQKRGLPHAHILLFWHYDDKHPTLTEIDRIISAKIPNYMVHGPYGFINLKANCMINNKCTKSFPKKFCRETSIDEDGFAIHMRRDHPDMYIERMALNCIYVSTMEACWRIFRFNIHYREPVVERLSFHLENEQSIIFEDSDDLDNVLNRPNILQTKFTEWMKSNAMYEEARHLTYSDFPCKWVRNNRDKEWNMRKQGQCVGRIYYSHPRSGERFYLRMLLNIVKRPRSFEEIRTVDNVLYPSFKSACCALGLLDDDKEWHEALNQASQWASRKQLHELFIKTYALYDIEQLLVRSGRSLREFENMPYLDVLLLGESNNRLLQEELDYNRVGLKEEHNMQVICSQLGELMVRTSLIIWNEASMAHRNCFEAVDRSLRDILQFTNVISVEKLFGGKTVVLSGDFCQILQVVSKGQRDQIVETTINRSSLWRNCVVFTMTQNMRLDQNMGDNATRDFANWILRMGDGNLSCVESEGMIEIPFDLIVQSNDHLIADIVNVTFPNLRDKCNNSRHLSERAILAPKNVVLETILQNNINFSIWHVYRQGNSLANFLAKLASKDCAANWESLVMVPPLLREFLNSLKFPGIPNHKLRLKIGLSKWVVEAKIMTGTHVGEKVFIPRIILSSSNSKLPFILKRRQFSIYVCFAMTINKSQGQTLEHVGLFLEKPVFSHGQLYVAISRVKRREGLKILVTKKPMMVRMTKMNIDCTHLNKLSTEKESWNIEVRILCMWDATNIANQRELFSLDLILADINVSCF